MKRRNGGKTLGLVALAVTLCAIGLLVHSKQQPVGRECFAVSYTADQAGYYTLLVDCTKTPEMKQTLSVYVNNLFCRKAAFPALDTEAVSVPVYLQKGKNELSLRVHLGDTEIEIEQIQVVKRAAPTKMVIAPHEDDETLAFAGSIMRMLEAGDDVLVVLVTHRLSRRAIFRCNGMMRFISA